MRRVAMIGIVGCIIILTLASMVYAQQPSFDAQLFRPVIFGGRFHNIQGAQTHWPLCWGVGMYVNYANSPMELRLTEGDKDDDSIDILNAVATANFIGAFYPTSWLAMGVDVPVHFYSRGKEYTDVDDPTSQEGLTDSAQLGDIRAELKFTATNIDTTRVGLAFSPFATFPTGNPDMFLGEGTTNFGGKVLLEVDAVIINIALNGGYLYREERDMLGVPLGSQWLYGVGLGKDFLNGFGFSVEAFGYFLDSGSVQVEEGSTDPQEVTGEPLEALAFVRYTLPNRVRFIGGGGGGITPGVGAPSYRVLAGMDYHPDCIPPTTGLLKVDVVNEQGLPVKSTLIIKKNKSGTFKTDGKGHFEREAAAGDYKISAAAKGYLPNTAKATVYVAKETYVKIVLKAPPKPTLLTIDVVHKKSGKKIPGAGILIKNLDTGKFKGIKAPEGTWGGEFTPGKYMFKGVAKGYEQVEVESTVIKSMKNKVTIKLRRKIIKIGKVQFAFDSAKLLPAAFPVLDDVVKKIKEADFTFKAVLIEGHTSSEGSDEYNMKLSQRRATSVKNYLVEKGLNPALLVVKPYGETKPITTNETEEGKEKNRRVEFIFEE